MAVRALYPQGHGHAGGTALAHQRSTCARPGCGSRAESLVAAVQHVEQRAHLHQRLTAGLLDGVERLQGKTIDWYVPPTGVLYRKRKCLAIQDAILSSNSLRR